MQEQGLGIARPAPASSDSPDWTPHYSYRVCQLLKLTSLVKINPASFHGFHSIFSPGFRHETEKNFP